MRQRTRTKTRFSAWVERETVRGVVSWNLHRRHLTASQRAAIAEELRPALEERARERQAHGLTAPGRTLPAILPEASGDSRDEAGALVGVTGRYVDHARAIREQSPAGAAQRLRVGGVMQRRVRPRTRFSAWRGLAPISGRAVTLADIIEHRETVRPRRRAKITPPSAP